MGIKKILSCILVGIILSGCAQSTAMIGPAITLASSGNISQAGLTFFTNKAVEKETGMQTHQFLAKKVEEQQLKQEDNRINKELSQMRVVQRGNRLSITKLEKKEWDFIIKLTK